MTSPPLLSSVILVIFDLFTFFLLASIIEASRLGPFGAFHTSLGGAFMSCGRAFTSCGSVLFVPPALGLGLGLGRPCHCDADIMVTAASFWKTTPPDVPDADPAIQVPASTVLDDTSTIVSPPPTRVW